MHRLMITLGMFLCLGCASKQHIVQHHAAPSAVVASSVGEVGAELGSELGSEVGTQQPAPSLQAQPVIPVAYSAAGSATSSSRQSAAAQSAAKLSTDSVAIETDVEPASATAERAGSPVELPSDSPEATLELNLPTALSMVGGQHPAVGFAQWRVQEAYAQLARAEAMWLPTIQAGFGFHRHDGNTQSTAGSILDLNRNSFQYGLGTGAVAAGTSTNPGLVAQFHLADAIFQPKISQRTARARSHSANSTVNQQLLNVALAYIELVDAYQDTRILDESRQRTEELAKITADFADAGAGLKADANRLETETAFVENRLIASRERIAVASARLTQALSLDNYTSITPLDSFALPIDLIAANSDPAGLISTGLATRPELKESQALVAAACEAFRREKVAPFVPSMLLGFSTGGFGGGLGNDLSNVDHRYDFDAVMTWQVRNFGLGESASRRETNARIHQAKFEQVRVMDQVAREVSEAHVQVQFRRQQIELMQRAIAAAQSSFDLNLERIRNGQGLPIEVLQSVQALESARRTYLRAVIDFNQAQFRLQWALGWPVNEAAANSLETNGAPAFVVDEVTSPAGNPRPMGLVTSSTTLKLVQPGLTPCG